MSQIDPRILAEFLKSQRAERDEIGGRCIGRANFGAHLASISTATRHARREGGRVMAENVESALLVSFPDQSQNFVHGFEAGMVWQRMQAGEPVIDSPLPYHFANCELFHRLAEAGGYDIECREVEDMENEWAEVTFVRLPDAPKTPALRVVK
jgi:hypothetical protein